MKFHGEFLPFLLSVLTQQALAAPSQVTLVKVTMETTEDIASNYCRRDLAYCGWNLIKRGTPILFRFLFVAMAYISNQFEFQTATTRTESIVLFASEAFATRTTPPSGTLCGTAVKISSSCLSVVVKTVAGMEDLATRITVNRAVQSAIKRRTPSSDISLLRLAFSHCGTAKEKRRASLGNDASVFDQFESNFIMPERSSFQPCLQKQNQLM
jgi:hypothetical protein